MSMIFCRSCGKEIHETAPQCPHCGAMKNNKSNQIKEIPPEVKGWSPQYAGIDAAARGAS